MVEESTSTNPYEVLGITEEAPDPVVEAAYKALVKETHPDQGGDAEKFSDVKKAYDAIKSKKYSSTKDEATDTSNFFNGLFSETVPAETISAVGDPNKGLSVEGEVFTVRLIGILPSVDVSNMVHLARKLGSNPYRTLVLFEIANNTEDVHKWHRDRTKYIDKDGFSYEREKTTIDSNVLSPRWTSFSVDLEAESKTYFAAMVEELPSNASLKKIVHTQKTHVEGKTSGWVQSQERYEFQIDELDNDLIALPAR